jgi:hypothetical protein
MLDRINGKGDLEEYHLELIHRGCWGSETWNEYMDVVIDFKLKEGLVETKRLVKIGNDGLISLKRLLRKYRNIDHFQFHDLGNSIYWKCMSIPAMPLFTGLSREYSASWEDSRGHRILPLHS